MALATYTDLQNSGANWWHRTDLSTVIPDWITMAESRINRILHLRVMEVETILPFNTIGQRTTPVPTGYIEPIGLWMQTTSAQSRQQLTFVEPQNMTEYVINGVPTCWTIDGYNVALDYPVVSASYIFTMRYLQSFGLSAANPTNWLLTNHPDLYLYGTLLESAPYIRDDDRITLWQNRFDMALSQIQQKEGWSKTLAPLQTDIGSSRSTFNIMSGN